MKYYKEAKYLWDTFVPKKGQAETVQGELIRAIEKLRDEAQRNGNINWDEGHVILSNYILEHLTAGNDFSDEDKEKIKKDVKKIQEYDNPYTENDLYDELLDYIVLWARKHKELILNPPNPNLHR